MGIALCTPGDFLGVLIRENYPACPVENVFAPTSASEMGVGVRGGGGGEAEWSRDPGPLRGMDIRVAIASEVPLQTGSFDTHVQHILDPTPQSSVQSLGLRGGGRRGRWRDF